MSTYNVCFCGVIREYHFFSTEKSALSGAMTLHNGTRQCPSGIMIMNTTASENLVTSLQ